MTTTNDIGTIELDSVTETEATPRINDAKMEQRLFRDSMAYMTETAADKKRRVILIVAAVLATETMKEVRTEYKAKIASVRKDAKDKSSVAFLTDLADIEGEIVSTTIDRVADALSDTVNTVVTEVPSVAAALRLCLDNPRQTIADGVKRIDFAARHLNVTADTRKAIGYRVDALSARWKGERDTRNGEKGEK